MTDKHVIGLMPGVPVPRRYTADELRTMPLGSRMVDQYGTVWVKRDQMCWEATVVHDGTSYEPDCGMCDLLLKPE